MKKYRLIVVADTVFRGTSIEDVKKSFMDRAETLDYDEWRFLLVEEVKA